jgi:hypothetical protein
MGRWIVLQVHDGYFSNSSHLAVTSNSPNGGSSIFPIDMQSRDPQRPSTGLDTDEFVENVVIDTQGQMAILTSQKRSFTIPKTIKSTADSLSLGFFIAKLEFRMRLRWWAVSCTPMVTTQLI